MRARRSGRKVVSAAANRGIAAKGGKKGEQGTRKLRFEGREAWGSAEF